MLELQHTSCRFEPSLAGSKRRLPIDMSILGECTAGELMLRMPLMVLVPIDVTSNGEDDHDLLSFLSAEVYRPKKGGDEVEDLFTT